MSRNLFDGSDDSEDNELQLNTNKEYAKSYNNFRKKELLKKFKDRGYDIDDSESASDSESSSEEDEPLDTKFDQEFLKTLASLKSKDPAIYDKNTKFFQALDDDADSEDESKGKVQKVKKSKPVTLKDYERQIILENGGKFEDDSDDNSEGAGNRPASPTVVEEERILKEEFKKVMNNSDSDEDEEKEEAFGGIFKKRNKSREEQEKEDADYLKWLAGKKDDIEDPIKEQLEPLKNYWSSSKLPQSERFLRDFILNKGYADTKSSDIPTYDEIVGDDEPLSEDEKELEKQAEFEQKYNFRFEEPDAEFIKRYPRTIEQSLRQSDDRRKQKRQETKERKKLEKEQKMKELDIIKEMKRKEMEEKIRKLKMVTGNEELGFKDEELEEDFDPEAHDKRMQEIFNEEFYQVDEGEEKPECPSDIEELKVEDWDNYDPNMDDGEDYYDPHCEDEDFNMDCDYDPAKAKEQLQKELIENTKKRKGRKGRKSQFMEMIKTEKPAFNPEDEKTYEEYIDEYYKLDCEDMIGDIPCRFKYVETTPNDFGLTIEEILLAKNKELNQWASLKKAIQIRPDHIEKKDQRLYKMKAKNEELKRKIFKSLYGEGSDEDDEKDENMNDQEQPLQSTPVAAETTNTTENAENNKKANKRKKRKPQAVALKNESGGTAADPNIPEKKPKLGEGPQAQAVVTSNTDTETKSKKKRKKRKAKTSTDEDVNAKQTNMPNQQLSTNNAQHPQNKVKNNNANSFKKMQHANVKNKPSFRGGANTNNKPSFKKVANSNNKPSFKNSGNPNNKPSFTNEVSSNNKPSFKNVASSTINTPKDSSSVQTKTNTANPFKACGSNAKNGFLKAHSGSNKAPFPANCKQRGKFKPNAKNFNKSSKRSASDVNISDERLKAYGINPKKFHKKKIFGKQQD